MSDGTERFSDGLDVVAPLDTQFLQSLLQPDRGTLHTLGGRMAASTLQDRRFSERLVTLENLDQNEERRVLRVSKQVAERAVPALALVVCSVDSVEEREPEFAVSGWNLWRRIESRRE